MTMITIIQKNHNHSINAIIQKLGDHFDLEKSDRKVFLLFLPSSFPQGKLRSICVDQNQLFLVIESTGCSE